MQYWTIKKKDMKTILKWEDIVIDDGRRKPLKTFTEFATLDNSECPPPIPE